MQKQLIGMAVALLVTMAPTPEAQMNQARTLLETARKIEMVDGDLPAAIAKYPFFWDGRTTSLEAQVLRPILDPNEMGSSAEAAAARVGLTPEDMANALASYVRSILSGNSAFDRYADGDRTALSTEEQAGLKVFRGKANCTACHIGPTLTDEAFHNTGVTVRGGRLADEGRFLVSGRESDRGAFKTPTLREMARTAAYMHDGSLTTLKEVIDFYDRGGRANPGLDAEIRLVELQGTWARMTDPARTGPHDSNGLTTSPPARATSRMFRVASVKPCTRAVAASRPSTTGRGSGTFNRPHSSAMARSISRIRSA